MAQSWTSFSIMSLTSCGHHSGNKIIFSDGNLCLSKEGATEVNKDNDGGQIMIPDKDPGDKVVDERNAVAEVTLPSTVYKSYLLSVFI